MQRDRSYERELTANGERMVAFLDEMRASEAAWEFKDRLAVQRALQILVESLIGMARYCVEVLWDLHVSRSREAIDELERRGELDREDFEKILGVIGFRNVLVHDYLAVDDQIVRALVRKGEYRFVREMLDRLTARLEDASP